MDHLELKSELTNYYNSLYSEAQIALDRINAIRLGKLAPLVTSSKKENNLIGGMYPGDLMVIAGRPGTGKSAKVLQDIADYLNPKLNPFYKERLIILFDSWEMPGWRNVLRLYSRKNKVTVKQIIDHQNRLSEETYNLYQEMTKRFVGAPLYFSKDVPTVSQWIAQKEAILKAYPDKYFLIVIDHTRLVLSENEKGEMELITSLLFAAVRLKRKYKVFFVFLSQMNRNIESGGNREKIGTRLPISSDIFGSDAVQQSADIVMGLHRPGQYSLEVFEGIPTGYVADDPFSSDHLLIEAILKQRDGNLSNLFMRHSLAVNTIEDLEEKALNLKQDFND